ncbi:MAG: hypothetical protein HQL75_00250 [Magnetococcales bacterium]|nr:hypothetical protein [Magnetococcales bacterium]
MSIESTDIKFFRSEIVSDGASNGGRMSNNESVSGQKNNLWADVPGRERKDGSIKWRKVFIKNANSDNLTGIDMRIFVHQPTAAADRVFFFAGTQVDTQADISGSHVNHGSGALLASATAGANSIQVTVENAADNIFIPGNLVRISNKPTVESDGLEEFIRIKNDVSGVTWSGDVATLTFEVGAMLLNSYASSDTFVSTVYEAGNLWAMTDTWAISSSTGTFSGWNGSGAVPPELLTERLADFIAGIEQTWTITFTSATAFSCSGNTLGLVGSGSTTANFAPQNTEFSRPYFTLPLTKWAGTWAIGDVLTFKTHPAAIPIWECRTISANSPSLSGNFVSIGVWGESE